MQMFFLAMTLYPDIQRKAQQELDVIVGLDRLPELDDRDSLVYTNAIVMECLQWHPATPLAMPHRTMADDEYRGYFIPKGTIVLGNS